MGSKDKRRDKRRKAREANRLDRPIPDSKREQGKRMIMFLVSFVIVAAGLVIFLQT